MNRKIIVIISLLLSGLLLLWFLPNDDKEIRKNMRQLATLCSATKGEGSIAKIANASTVSKLCTDPCSIDIESFDIQKAFIRKEISQHMLVMKRMLPDTHFSFTDTEINFPQKNRADITTTLSLKSKTKNQRFTDAYELDIVARKIDGDWLFSAFTVVEFMER